MKKPLLIFVDHGNGPASVKMLNKQLNTKIGICNELAVYAKCNTNGDNSTFQMMMLKTEKFPTDSLEQISLRGLLPNFTEQLNLEQFLSYICSMKNQQYIGQNAIYLFLDINLGNPGFRHMTELAHTIIQEVGASDSCSTLNLYPYSQEREAWAEGNQYVSGQKTPAYNDKGIQSEGFQLTISAVGLCAPKVEMIGKIEAALIAAQEEEDAAHESVLEMGNF
ncbi:MAG: hypothetical protein Q8R83_04640 [Legionellaceae bacterium]|nr:hypothetical protein [Legionellaceae bacterium]